jgi:hypothetical protein
MSATIPFKRLILRAVLRGVSPMVARLISVSDDTELNDLHDVFRKYWAGGVMDIQEGAATEDPYPICLGGRGWILPRRESVSSRSLASCRLKRLGSNGHARGDLCL